MTKNYYAILGISYPSTPDEINRAYKVMAKKWHPDLHPNEDVTEQMKEVNESAEILRDPIKKARYDREYQAAFGTESKRTWKENPEYDVKDENLKNDINVARKNAEEFVKEFFSELKETSKDAAKGAWKFAKPLIIVFIVVFICAQFCTGFIEGVRSTF